MLDLRTPNVAPEFDPAAPVSTAVNVMCDLGVVQFRGRRGAHGGILALQDDTVTVPIPQLLVLMSQILGLLGTAEHPAGQQLRALLAQNGTTPVLRG